MPRTIWTKAQSDPNGTWTRYEGQPPFSIPAVGGRTYDVRTDAGESFVITPAAAATAPVISGLPTLAGLAEVGQTLIASPASSTGTAPINTGWQWLRDGVDIPGATADNFALTAADAGTGISLRQTASNAAGSDSATSTTLSVVSSSGAVAVVTGLLVSSQTPSGEVELAYSITRDSGVTGVLTRAATTPSATRILAGQNHLGGVADSAFSDLWTVAGSDTLSDIASGLGADTYYLHVLPDGGGDADVISSNGFQLETVAPQIVSAQTSLSGFDIRLVLSEDLAGSTTAADWSLTANGAAQTVLNTAIEGTGVTLTLSAPVPASQTLLLSYSGSSLTDTVANRVAAIAGRAVTNLVSATFTENAVTVPSGSYLTAPGPLPATSRALLFFASLTQSAGHDTRAALATWSGTSGGFHSDYTSGNAAGGIRLRVQSGTATITQGSEPVPLGTRYHLLVSSWIDATDFLNVRAWIFNTAAGSWAEAVNTNTATTPGATLQLGPDPLRLFARSDGGSHGFAGTINRLAFWAGAGSSPIADISDTATRTLFADSTAIKEPTLSRISLGQPLVDFAGPAAAYNSGTHTGSLGAFIPTSSFG